MYQPILPMGPSSPPFSTWPLSTKRARSALCPDGQTSSDAWSSPEAIASHCLNSSMSVTSTFMWSCSVRSVRAMATLMRDASHGFRASLIVKLLESDGGALDDEHDGRLHAASSMAPNSTR